MDIIDRVPFDLVPAYHEREAARAELLSQGPLGKILRRHREDASTTLIHTMLKACVEKRWDGMLWDTFAEAIRRQLPHLGPADIGLLLFCCVKADYRRDAELIPLLLKQLAAFSMTGKQISRSGPSLKAFQDRQSSRMRRQRPKQVAFPEHALLAGFLAAQHYRLGQRCGDDVAKLVASAVQGCSTVSNDVLCRIVHHASNIASGAGSQGPTKLLQGVMPELQRRLQDTGTISSSSLCLIAHAYVSVKKTDIFQAIRRRLLEEGAVPLLKLGTGELTNVANAFCKMSDAGKNGNVELLDRIGRQLLKAFQPGRELQDALDLRNACVALNAFAQASLRHEPFFVACEDHLPVLLSQECDIRQLAMIAHAFVRVGLVRSCLLPLVWDRAMRLAPESDAQGVSLMLFAVTKAAPTAGAELLRALTSRLLRLLQGESVAPQTLVVSAYALAKSGYKDSVEFEVWHTLADLGRRSLSQLSITEAANLAAALAEVWKGKQPKSAVISGFFQDLTAELNKRLVEDARSCTPQAASKLISAFADVQCSDAAGVAQILTRRFVLPSPPVPRSVTQALSKLHVFDDDLMQALMMLQKRKR